jgi:uncharacterized membrane protein
MEWLFPWFLLLHVLAAILAFGPTFAFPLIGGMGGKEPQHANFATRVSDTISHRQVIPLALSMPVTGAAMILVAGLNLTDRRFWWLDIAIVLYVIAITFALLVQTKNVERLIEATSGPPPGARGGPPAGAGAPPAAMGAGAADAAGPAATGGPPPGAAGPTATGGPPPGAGGPPPGVGGPPPGAGGPPPHIREAVARVQRGGMVTGLLIIAIVFLMVVKPQF